MCRPIYPTVRTGIVYTFRLSSPNTSQAAQFLLVEVMLSRKAEIAASSLLCCGDPQNLRAGCSEEEAQSKTSAEGLGGGTWPCSGMLTS